MFFLLIPIIAISQEISEPSLKKHSEFPIGTSIRFVEFMKDKKLKKLQKHHFDSYTAGNDMKMYQIVTREGNYNWARVDSIINYTTLNNQRLFGHTLIWHSATPKWVEKKAMSNPQWLEKFMKEYINKYVVDIRVRLMDGML